MIFTAIQALTVAVAFSTTGDDRSRGPLCDPLTDGAFVVDWPITYVESIGNGYPKRLDAAPTISRTPQPREVWESLVTLPESPEISFFAREWAGPLQTPGDVGLVTLEDPVLVVTWSSNASYIDPNSTPPIGLLQTYAPKFENGTWILAEYRANPDDQLLNQWLTIHQPNADSETGFSQGTLLDFLVRSLDVERECLNPSINPPSPSSADPCDASIFMGVAGVGMPYAFANLGADVFDDVAPAPWWRQQLFVFVVERDALIRPSYNPNPKRTTPGLPTGNGVPIFDPAAPGGASYRFPRSDDDIWRSYLEATDGERPFVGYANGEIYRGSYGFREWLYKWQSNSWGDPAGSSDLGDWAQNFAFPFSSIGLTLNWPGFDPGHGSIATAPFGALSEFIHKGEQSMYLVAIREGYQYMSPPNEFLGEVSWCDTCPADLNRDGTVDAIDLSMLLVAWGTTSTCYTIDKSLPRVGVPDLARLLAAWGPCGWPLPKMRPDDCFAAP